MNLPECVICFAIVEDGVFTPCCNTTYCKACLNSWLMKHHNCPQCRKALQNVSQTIPVSRILARLNIPTDKVPPSEKEIQEFIETVATNSSSNYHVAQFKKDFEETLSRVPTIKEINSFIRLQGQLNLPSFSDSKIQYPPPPPISSLLLSSEVQYSPPHCASSQSIVYPLDDDHISSHHQSQSPSSCSVSPPMQHCSRASQHSKSHNSTSSSPSSPSVRSLPTPPYALTSSTISLYTSPPNSNNNQTVSYSSSSSNSSPQNILSVSSSTSAITNSQLLRPVYSNQPPTSPSYSTPSTSSSSSSSLSPSSLLTSSSSCSSSPPSFSSYHSTPPPSFSSSSSPSPSSPSPSSSSSSSFSSSSFITLSSSSSSSRTFTVIHIDSTLREQRQYRVSCVPSCLVGDMVGIFKSTNGIPSPPTHTFYVCAFHLPFQQYLRFPLNTPVAAIPENSCLFISSTRNSVSAFFLVIRLPLPSTNTGAGGGGSGGAPTNTVNTSVMIAAATPNDFVDNTNTNANTANGNAVSPNENTSRRESKRMSRYITGLDTTTNNVSNYSASRTVTRCFIPFLYPNETMLILQNVVQFVEDNVIKHSFPRKMALSFTTSNNGRAVVFPTEGIPPYALTTETIVYVD